MPVDLSPSGSRRNWALCRSSRLGRCIGAGRADPGSPGAGRGRPASPRSQAPWATYPDAAGRPRRSRAELRAAGTVQPPPRLFSPRLKRRLLIGGAVAADSRRRGRAFRRLPAAPEPEHQGLLVGPVHDDRAAAGEGDARSPQGIVWPMWGYDGAAPARAGRDLAAAAVPEDLDVPRAHAARVPSGRRVRAALPDHVLGPLLRAQREDREARVAVPLGPLRLVVARRREARRLSRPSSAIRAATAACPGTDGEVVALNALTGKRALAADDRARRVLAARRARARLRRQLERRRSGRCRREDGRAPLAFQTGGPVKGSVAVDGPERRRRLLRRPRLRAERAHRQGGLARLGAAAVRLVLARHLLLDAGGRLRPRLHREHRREDLLLRRDDGRPRSGRTRPAATSTPRRRSGTSASTRAPTTARSTRSTPRPATRSGRSRRTGRSRARRR